MRQKAKLPDSESIIYLLGGKLNTCNVDGTSEIMYFRELSR